MKRTIALSLVAVVSCALLVAGCKEERDRTPTGPVTGAGEYTLVQVVGASLATRHVLPVDVDGDSDLDLFLSNFGEQNRLLVNDGSGEFTDSTGLPLAQNFSTHAAFADVDGDGDNDIVVANNGQNVLLFNDGTGRFTDGTDPLNNVPGGLLSVLDDTRAVAFINVDATHGDTDPDLVVINNGQNRLYLNAGGGEFVDGTDLTQTYTSGMPLDNESGRSVTVLDMDGDGDLDFIVGNENGPDRIYLNSPTPGIWEDGWGEFADTTFDTAVNPVSLPYYSGTTYAIQADNLDNSGDGSIDLVLAVDGENRVFLNDGNGFFTDAGADWARERTHFTGDLLALDGEGLHLYAPGTAGQISQYPSGGPWASLGSVTGSDLLCAASIPLTTSAFAAGRSGVVVENYSTGTFAIMAQNQTSEDLHGCVALASNSAWFVGDGGTVVRWDGSNWHLDHSFSTDQLSAVHGSGASEAFVVGYNDTILQWNGTTWTPMASNLSAPGTFLGIWREASNNVFAVGAGGLILHYSDPGSGLLWRQETGPTTYSLNAVAGTGATNVIAVGNSDLVNSDFNINVFDGSTWTAVQPGLDQPRNLNDIYVDASGEAFAVGEGGTVLHYDTATWTAQTQWDLSVSSPTGTFTPGETVTGGTSTATGVVVNWDAGNDILTIRSLSGTFDLLTPDTISGASGSATLTGFSAAVSGSLRGVCGTSPTDCYAVGTGPVVLQYTGGTVWNDVTPPGVTADLNDCWISGTDLYAVGAGGVILHCNTTTMAWNTSITSPVTTDLLAVWGSGLSDIYAVGASGTVIRWNGTDWYVVSSGRLNDVSATSTTDLWAVGDAGWILHSAGGSLWVPETSVPTQADLLGVHALTTSNVVAVGRGGAILHYNGSSWSAAASPTTEDLHDVYGVDGSNIFACGDNGTVLHYNGSAWSAYYDTGCQASLRGVWATSAVNVWAVGTYATCIHYTGAPSSKGFVSAAAADSRTVAVVDVNADSHPDLVFGNCSGTNTLWLNAGVTNPGRFTLDASGYLPTDTDDTHALAKGNFDATWPTQLVLGNCGSQSRLYLRNPSSGHYEDKTDLGGVETAGLPPTLPTASAVLVDVDGDGDLDVVTAVANGQNRLYRNEGSAFVDGTSDAPATVMPSDSSDSRGVAMADLDGNGMPDLVFANHGSQNRVYLNQSNGTYSDATSLPYFPADADDSVDVAVGDLDGDGDMDVVFANDGGQNRVYRLSSGNYTDDTAAIFPTDTAAASRVVLVDVDGDTDLDVIFCVPGGQNLLYLNQLDQTGVFLDATTSSLPTDTDQTAAAAVADVDGDGDPDLVFVNDGEQNRLLINNGGGQFTDKTAIATHLTQGLPTATGSTRGVVLVDADGDGDNDLVFANHGEQNRLLLNDGNGLFTDETDEVSVQPWGLAVSTSATTVLLAGDLDGDGDPDLYVGNLGPDEVLHNR